MKALKKSLAILMVFSMVLSLGIVSAFANGGTTPPAPASTPTTAPESQYEWEQNGLAPTKDLTATKFSKYLVLFAGAQVPDAQFKFTIKPGDDGGNAWGSVFIKPVPADSSTYPADYATYRDAATGAKATSRPYNVIGTPKFVANTAAGIEVPATQGNADAKGYSIYAGDTAIVTYKKGDATKTEDDASNSSKTIDFMTDYDSNTAPSATNKKYWAKDEIYAEKEFEVSFADVTFLEPGVYRYTVTEIAAYTNAVTPLPGMLFDADVNARGGEPTERYLDVYVVDNNGKLEVQEYVLHEKKAAPVIDTYSSTNTTGTNGTNEDSGKDLVTQPESTSYNDPGVLDASNANELKDKSTGFSNQYATKNLIVRKQVEGNQASRDKFFEITVTVNEPSGVTFTDAMWFELNLDKTGADAADANNWVFSPAQNVATTYTHDDMDLENNPNYVGTSTSDLKAENGRVFVKATALKDGKKFYLQHNTSITLLNLPAHATFTVTELNEDYRQDKAALDNYKNQPDRNVTLLVEDEYKREDGAQIPFDQDTIVPDGVVATSFKNVRDGVIPTGILSVIAPAVAVIVLGAAGLGFVVASRRREEEAEEA